MADNYWQEDTGYWAEEAAPSPSVSLGETTTGEDWQGDPSKVVRHGVPMAAGVGFGSIPGAGFIAGPLAASVADIGMSKLYGEGEPPAAQRETSFATDLLLGAAPAAVKGAVKGGQSIYRAAKGLPEAERIYQGALKPSTALKRAEVQKRIATGLSEGIEISDKGIETVRGRIANLNDQVGQAIDTVKYSGKVRKQDVLDSLTALRNKYAAVDDIGEYTSTIDDYIARFNKMHGDEIPISQAQAMKQDIYKKNHLAYERAKKIAMGNTDAATIQARKTVARSIREQIEKIVPEVKFLNANEARLIGLQESLEKAVGRVENWDMIGLSEPLAGILVGGGSGAGRIASMLGYRYLKSAEVRSKIALALNRRRIPISPGTREMLALPPGPTPMPGKVPESYVKGVPSDVHFNMGEYDKYWKGIEDTIIREPKAGYLGTPYEELVPGLKWKGKLLK